MPRFCRDCGAPIGVRAPVACPACGAEHWRNASPGGAALVAHEGRLLLIRRAHEPWRDLWCSPSGFCDGDEHPAAAAAREAFEEVGLRIRIVGCLGHWIDEYLPGGAGGEDPQWCAVTYYTAVPLGGVELELAPAEVAEARWFAPDELPADIAPPGSGPRILAAWRGALAGGRLETPLPDLPS